MLLPLYNGIIFRTCTDIDECEKFKDSKLCIGTCQNVPGSYTCKCPPGYKLGSDQRVCKGSANYLFSYFKFLHSLPTCQINTKDENISLYLNVCMSEHLK